MLAFHMYCHEDEKEAARIARDPINRYLKSLVDAAKDWINGAASDNYKGYGKLIEALDRETFESQVEKGSAWVGTPDELAEQIRSYDREIGGFDDASMQVNFNDLSYDDAEQSVNCLVKGLCRPSRRPRRPAHRVYMMAGKRPGMSPVVIFLPLFVFCEFFSSPFRRRGFFSWLFFLAYGVCRTGSVFYKIADELLGRSRGLPFEPLR